MPRVSPLQNNFNCGEVSPLAWARVDSDRFKACLETCKNFIPTLQGPLTRRTGTYFVKEVKQSANKTRLVKFQFSTTQAYMIEFGNLYCRFFKNGGVVEISPGNAYEIVTPYLAADLFNLRFTQSADTLYIVHPSYAPRKLERLGDANWVIAQIDFQDGPYLPQNTGIRTWQLDINTGTSIRIFSTIAPQITNAVNNGSGLIRLTCASAHALGTGDTAFVQSVLGTVEANGMWEVIKIDDLTVDLIGSTFVNAFATSASSSINAGFRATEVGRLIRMKAGSSWGWAKIVSVNEATNTYRVDIKSAIGGTGSTLTTQWQMGVWCPRTGFPACATFHEDRLSFSGASAYPDRVDASNSSDYENFAPTALDGTVTGSNALSFTFSAAEVNASRWLVSDEKGLLTGTQGREWVTRPSSQGEALTPSNITAKSTTSFGSANVQPVQVGKSVLFLQPSGKKLRELIYNFYVDGFQAEDLTLLSENITLGGVVEMAFQKEPQPTLLAVRADGTLLGMTYERGSETLKAGWFRIVLGGSSDAAGTPAAIESVAVMPSADGSYDEIWVIVRRYINGQTKRYVEKFSRPFDSSIDQKNAFFVDSGSTYDSPKAITGATKANPVVITGAGHGFSTGDTIVISDVVGMTDLNTNVYTVGATTTNTYELSGVDGTGYGAYISGGNARKRVTTISGLSYLEGETLSVLGDGAVLPKVTVSSGSVTLSSPAAVVQLGYGYMSDGKMMRIEAGAADGTALGKVRRIQRVGFFLYRTLGLKFGADFDSLFEIDFRKVSDPMDHAPSLFTGIKAEETTEFDYDTENQLCFRVDDPVPATLLAIMPKMETQDGG